MKRNATIAAATSAVLATAALAASVGVSGKAAPEGVAGRYPPVVGAGDAGATRLPTGKPRPPVRVVLLPEAEVVAGVPGKLLLAVRSRLPIDAVDLEVGGDAGLTVVAKRKLTGSPAPGDKTALQEPAEAARFEISATPTSGGTRYLSGLLRFTVNGVEQAAPFSLPVQVSGPVTVPATMAKPERVLVRDAGGELVDSMPAETKIR